MSDAMTDLRAFHAFWGFRYVLTPLQGYDWKTGKTPNLWTRIPCSAHL